MVKTRRIFSPVNKKVSWAKKILELWREGRRDDAAKLLADLLIVEGWNQERWERLDTAASRPAHGLLDLDGSAAQEEVGVLLAYTKSRDLDLSKRKGADGHRLGELLDGKLPEWAFLLLSAVQSTADKTTQTFRRVGRGMSSALERDRYGKVDRDSLLNFISQRLRQAGKNIEPQARDLIVAVPATISVLCNRNSTSCCFMPPDGRQFSRRTSSGGCRPRRRLDFRSHPRHR